MNKSIKILFIFLILSFSVFFLSGCTSSKEESDEYARIISDSDILIDGKQYTLAIEKLSEASDLIPSKRDAFERMVKIFISKNRMEDASKIIEESGGQLSEQDKAILYSLVGDGYYNYKNFEKALYSYQLANGMDSGYLPGSLGMAKSFIQVGQIEKARKLLEEKYEGDMLIEAKLVLSYVDSLTDAKKAKETIKDVEPGEVWRDSYVKWEEVLNSLNEDKLFNLAKLGKEYVERGYPYLAIALLEPEVSKMDEYIDGIYILGKAYYEYGQYQKSIDLLESTSSLGDLNKYIYWVLARDYVLLNDINSAFSYYDSAIAYSTETSDSLIYKEYLDILLEENLTEKALEVMRSAEKIFVDESWVPMYYMKGYSLRSDNEKFSYYMNKVEYEELEPSQKAEYLYSQGDFLIKSKKLEEAQKVVDVYWDLDQFDPRYNLLVARLKFENGDVDQARDYAKKCLEYDLNGLVSKEAQSLLAQID
jgi:hypothetical protein